MSEGEHRTRRRRSIRSALGTSLLSKVSSSVLQFVSLPVAARVLGREEFGIYATVAVSLYAINILQIGVGPALARGIAEASARDDHDRERGLCVSGALLGIGLALVGVAIAALLITFVPITTLFGAKYGGWESVLVPALWTGVALMAADMVARHADRLREGYMEASTAMGWVAVGNLLGAVTLALGIHRFPNASFILLAVFVPNILVRFANLGFLFKKRPWLLGKVTRGQIKAESRSLLGDGVSFSATTAVVHLVEFKLCALLVGRILGPADVAIHLVLLSITTAFIGLLSMVGVPLWAAIVDAKAKGDRDWMLGATRRYYQYLALLTAGAGLVLISIGPWLVPTLYGSEFEIGRLIFVGHAAFLFAIGWRQVNRYLAIGLDLLTETVRPIVVGLCVSTVLGVAGLYFFGLWALFLGLAMGSLSIPGTHLPRIVRRGLIGEEPSSQPALLGTS